MKAERWVVCSDVHGDNQDSESTNALIAFIQDFKPTIRICAGDLWDFRNLRKGASDEEKACSLEDDWESGIEFASKFFDGGKHNTFLRGNHDERLWYFRNSCTGLIRDYANDGIKRVEGHARRWKASMLPWDAAHGIARVGKLKIVHGFHAGKSACKEHAAVYGNVLFGHVHTIESAPVASLEPAEARSIGCMCIRDMDYVASKTGKLRWGQGWAYGTVDTSGNYTILQARKINGSFTCSTEFKVY